MEDVCRLHGHEKVCPKDSYTLPQVDILVDLTARHQLLSFMDAFSGYYQIKLDKADQEKTSFVTGPLLIQANAHLGRWLENS